MTLLNSFNNPSDIETPYAPLLRYPSTHADEVVLQPRRRFRTSKLVLLFLTGFLGVLVFVLTYGGHQLRSNDTSIHWRLKNVTQVHPRMSHGVSQGVSEKRFRLPSEASIYPWTTHMLAWQRTAFHFQPKQNWMNDPNGPLVYKGWYHLFYQYNPQGAVWGNIVWGHAASEDLIHWRHLPIAMVNDSWYDINGVWTGSATILQDGRPVMLYTGSTNESVQVQNLAYPLDLSDPLLVNWVKYPGNPVMVPPRIVEPMDFRDPTTAWLTKEGKWRITIGSKFNTTGTSLVYETIDFKEFVRLEGVLHAVAGTGMWECVDFYPVSKVEEIGLDTSEDGPNVKHVMKTSLDDERNDYYSLGTYNSKTGSWTPDDQNIDVGIGMKYDYGIFYASKTFYDHDKKRRVLWGWIKETDSERADIQKGWASLQGIPRTIVFDKETGNDIKFWPVEEVEKLRAKQTIVQMVKINPGSVVPLNLSFAADQVDILAEFQIDEHALKRIEYGRDANYSCTTSGGAASRGVVGPFGLLVLTDKDFSEQTPLFFYISRDSKGSLKTFFCTDHSRSSMATDVAKEIYGSIVPVVVGEKLTMRIIVDHSIIEGFAQGGRTCITSRAYPTKAIYEDAHMFLFNNATNAKITASLKIWQMSFGFRSIMSYMISLVSLCLSCSVLLQTFVL